MLISKNLCIVGCQLFHFTALLLILFDQITPRFAMLLFRNYDDIFLTFPNTQVYVDAAEPVTETVK